MSQLLSNALVRLRLARGQSRPYEESREYYDTIKSASEKAREHQEELEQRWRSEKPVELHPAVRELLDLIEKDTRIELLAHGMFDEADPLINQHGKEQPPMNVMKSLQELLHGFNHMVTEPPPWNTSAFLMGLICCPIYAHIREPMHTTCGFAFFLDPQVNTIIKKILNEWGRFLQSPESASCLNTSPSGWFSPEAYAHLTSEANLTDDDDLHTFEEMFYCDPSKPHHGFKSWDDFFIRQFRPGIRPVAGPGDGAVVANACESLPWRISHNVKHEDKFWTKGTPYSLKDMLGNDELSKHLAGGTVYQAYLSALSYHRWHSPVSGRIVKVFLVDGTYFSEPPHRGFGDGHDDSQQGDINWAAAYMTATATRAVFFIEADNPDIGLMAVVMVGMTEVSTCEPTVVTGQRVEKGQEIGMFHFGGSTHCVIFRKEVEVLGLPDPKTMTHNVPVRGRLATVRRRQYS